MQNGGKYSQSSLPAKSVPRPDPPHPPRFLEGLVVMLDGFALGEPASVGIDEAVGFSGFRS